MKNRVQHWVAVGIVSLSVFSGFGTSRAVHAGSSEWELQAGGNLVPVPSGGEAPAPAESWQGLPGHGHIYRVANPTNYSVRIEQITATSPYQLEIYPRLPVTIAPGANLTLFRMAPATAQVGTFKGTASIRWSAVSGSSARPMNAYSFRVVSQVAAGPRPAVYRTGSATALAAGLTSRVAFGSQTWGTGEGASGIEIRNLGDRAFGARFVALSDLSIPGCARITPENQLRSVTPTTPFVAQILVNRAVPGLCTFKVKVTTDSQLYPELIYKGNVTITPQAAGAWKPLMPMYLQHYFENAVEFNAARSQPGFFSLFNDATFQYRGPAPSTIQVDRKVHYLHTNILPRAGYFAEYPFQAAMFEHDETAYVHSDDPAQLVLKEEFPRMHLFWKTDSRGPNNRHYKILRLVTGSQTPDRREVNWWRTEAWQYQGLVTEAAGQTSTYVDWVDPNLAPLAAGQEVCYRVITNRTGDGHDYEYSLPVCQRLARTWVQEPYFMIGKAEKVMGLPETPIQIQYAPGQYMDRMSTYDFRVIIKEFAPNQVTQVTVANFSHLNEYGNFNQHGPASNLTITREGSHVIASGRLAFPVRRMFSDYPHTTEGVFKFSFRWRKPNGQYADVMYPNRGGQYWDGGTYTGKGFITPFPNNRVQDYMWAQMYLNIANHTYRTAFVNEMDNLRARGYQGVFIDEWRSERTADDRYTMGWQQEAPFYEYPYRTNAEGVVSNPAVNVRLNSLGPVVTDPWLREQDRFAAYLRENSTPDWLMFGNTLRGFDSEYTERTASTLDGGMMEGCLYRPYAVPGNPAAEEFHNQIWRNTLGIIERSVASNRVMVCLQGESLYSWYEPASRLFSAASFLLKWAPGSRAYFGPPIQEPRWNNNTAYFGDDLMHFPEFHLSLGRPLNPATVSPDGQLYQREYEAGWVAVAIGTPGASATAAQWTVNFPRPVRRVQIEGVVRTNVTSDAYRYDSILNPGKLRLDAPVSSATLGRREGAIFLKVPQ